MTATKRPGMSNGESAHWGYLMSLIPIRDQKWIERAACAGHPTPDLWFPSDGRGRPPKDGEPKQSEQVKEAKRICAACPVRTECLTFSIENKESHGLWGGVGREKRRDAIRKAAEA